MLKIYYIISQDYTTVQTVRYLREILLTNAEFYRKKQVKDYVKNKCK